MIDCLLIGFNDSNFDDYVGLVKAMGTDSGAYRDLRLAFVELDNQPYRSMDLLNRFYFEDKPQPYKLFHNSDFLWPVMTYLSSYLNKHGYSADYVNLFHLEKEKLIEKLKRNDILTIAITTTLYVSPHPILEIISFIRQYNDTAKIVVGGPYISNQIKITDQISSQQLFKYLGADFYVISQEGEHALVSLLAALKGKQSLEDVDNLAYRKNGRYAITKSSIESNPLEENMINYRLFERAEMGEFLSLRTAKSCPFSCSFCGFPARAGKYKYTGVELVEQELNAINDLETVTTLTFIDDTFNVPKTRFKDILRMMIRNKYEFKWNCFYRSDHGDEETIELMGKAGCEGVFLGVESGSDKMLEVMNKTSRRRNYLEAIPLLRKAGISTYASLIVGFPGETYDTVQETIDFIEEAKPDFYRAQLWYADPVTPIWEQTQKYGITGAAFNWTHSTMTAKIACDLIDKMFLCIENSIWLPQFGFEQWSTFYLQRRGMTLAQIKQFLKRFNAAIKQQLVFGDQNLDPRLLESLRASCKFDQEVQADSEIVEAYSGAVYMAAEKYCVEEFRTLAPRLNLEMDREQPSSLISYEEEMIEIAIEELPLLQERSMTEISDMLLAAYGIFLSRLNGTEDAAVLVLESGAQDISVLPLRLQPSSRMKAADYINAVRRKKDEASKHHIYALHILSNPLRMSALGATAAKFEAGYVFETQQSEKSDVWTTDQLSGVSLKLRLNASALSDSIKIKLSFAAGLFAQDSVRKLSAYFTSIFNEIASDPQVTVASIGADQQQSRVRVVVDSHASENFNFN